MRLFGFFFNAICFHIDERLPFWVLLAERWGLLAFVVDLLAESGWILAHDPRLLAFSGGLLADWFYLDFLDTVSFSHGRKAFFLNLRTGVTWKLLLYTLKDLPEWQVLGCE
ncbi:MAG: hypothetical protein ABS938_03770 [Psychrobacillus psychrodurans]